MIQVRRNVFETNSSSTHSIAIATDDSSEMEIPSKITFRVGKFGWEFCNYHDCDSKASYFYTALYENYNKDEAEEIANRVKEYIENRYNVEVILEKPELEEWEYNGKKYCSLKDGYIDHASSAWDFIDVVVNDYDLLMDFLFKYDSFVATGNDNCYEYELARMERPSPDKKYREFFKGN